MREYLLYNYYAEYLHFMSFSVHVFSRKKGRERGRGRGEERELGDERESERKDTKVQLIICLYTLIDE